MHDLSKIYEYSALELLDQGQIGQFKPREWDLSKACGSI